MIIKFFKLIKNIFIKTLKYFGIINSWILLTIFYYLIFGTVAIIRKIFMSFKIKPDKNTYWIEKKEFKDVNYENQY